MTKQNKTYIAIAGITILGALTGFLVVKKLKKSKEGKNELPTSNSNFPVPNSNMIPQYTNQTVSNKPVVPTPDYAALTQRLVDAMSGWGTDEETIFNTLRLLRVGQLDELIDHFNKTQEKTLQWWLKEELDSSELEQIKKIWIKHGKTF
jgi:hypothetical protein